MQLRVPPNEIKKKSMMSTCGFITHRTCDDQKKTRENTTFNYLVTLVERKRGRRVKFK